MEKNIKSSAAITAKHTNDVIPQTILDERHPLFFYFTLNGKYYLSAFGQVLSDSFDNLEDLKEAFYYDYDKYLETAIICANYTIYKHLKQSNNNETL